MRIVFFSAAIMASGLAVAAAPIDGWYANLFGGYAYIPGNINTVFHNFYLHGSSYRTGFNAGGRIGYKSNPMRYEAEVTYIHAKLAGYIINLQEQTGVSGQFNDALGMLNIYYDFPEMVPCIAPFLSAGLGYAWVQSRLNSNGPTGNKHFTRSNGLFAYQGSGGFIFNFAENYSLDIAYRYVGTERADNLGQVVQAHLASIGVTYRFDEGSYK